MRVVAITGGGQGIGRGIAVAFASASYVVSIADIDRCACEETLELVRKAGSNGLYEISDISQPTDVSRWIERTRAEFGCPHVLVNNAAIMVRKPFLELAVGEFDKVQSVNVRGTFLCSQTVARCMVASGMFGSIINIASTRASMSEAGSEAYTASKGAVVSLTRGMAISLGAYGIRVNSISPGWIETRDWKVSHQAQTPTQSAEDRAQHPVGRVGVPADIAKACLFLADSADFITGQNLVVDGGMTVKMIYA